MNEIKSCYCCWESEHYFFELGVIFSRFALFALGFLLQNDDDTRSYSAEILIDFVLERLFFATLVGLAGFKGSLRSFQ
jgi:hypothetical protein